MKQRNRETEKQVGFTVVELLVAMTVFVATTSFAVGIFIQGMQSQRRLTQEIAVNNEMTGVLEQMIREIRTGYLFRSLEESLEDAVSHTGSRESEDMKFESQRGTITYSRAQEGGIWYISSGGRRLTSKDVAVEDLGFVVFREERCDPWRVTIRMQVSALASGRTVPIQTTVSSRVLPVDLSSPNAEGLNAFQECRSNLVVE